MAAHHRCQVPLKRFQPLVSAAVPGQYLLLTTVINKGWGLQAAFHVPGAALESGDTPVQYHTLLQALAGT